MNKSQQNKKLLEVSDLATRFYTDGQVIHSVNGVSFHIKAGESVAIVGESGSGKSVSMMSIMGLVPNPPGKVVRGSALFDGVDLLQLPEKAMQSFRGKRIAMIFQDPMTSLNPVLTIERQMTEALQVHLGLTRDQAIEKALEKLRLVGIPRPEERIKNYPYQFSGGQRQRIMIAMALSCEPDLLIADEPTTALDVTIQAQIVELIQSLQKQFGMSVIWISHNLALVAGVVDRVIVMYGGYIVEQAPVDEIFSKPLHPYTQGLLNAIPKLDGKNQSRLQAIDGLPPDLRTEPTSCPFAARCPIADEVCRNSLPVLDSTVNGRQIRCWKVSQI